VLVSAATMIGLLAVALLLLMTPVWMHAAISASGGWQVTGDPQTAYELSDRAVGELFVGPGTFSYFGPDEAAHLRDVRVVLYLFLALAVASVAFLAWRLWRTGTEPGTWLAVARGGVVLAVGLAVAGAVAAVAFDAAFELFHRLLFPGGNFSFPASSTMIRLYPVGFWQLSAAAIGALGISGGLLTWWLATRRAATLADR
jgi:hypothetical protein